MVETLFTNAYEDPAFADAYSRLEFPGTYYLAYRDLPAIIAEHVAGRSALDFGCGAGRSTRFLRHQGFDTVGLDISSDMIQRARTIDPSGDYRLIQDGSLRGVEDLVFDLVLCAFTFDNIPTMVRKVALFRGLRNLLSPQGRIINLVSSPDIYTREWASFSTAAYPENWQARSGDIVRIVNTAITDSRPVEDVLWTDDAYRDAFKQAGITIVQTYRPLGLDDEPFPWVNETRIAPWVIYVLRGTEA